MATAYDPNVLQKYADKLYNDANRLVFLSATIGFLLSLPAFGVLAAVVYMRSPRAEVGAGWLLFLALAGLALGWAWGRGKAFQLRLEAQRTLCQVQIEQNTRGAVSAAAATPGEPPRQLTCPKCANSFPAGTQFCGYCGTPLPAAPPGLGRASE
jgi:hypothetical protein